MQTAEYVEVPSRPTSRDERMAYAVARILAGERVGAIAEKLGVTMSTVKTYLKEHDANRAWERWTEDRILDRIRDWYAIRGRAPRNGEWSSGWTYGNRSPVVTVDDQDWPSDAAIGVFFSPDMERCRGWFREWSSLEMAIKAAGLPVSYPRAPKEATQLDEAPSVASATEAYARGYEAGWADASKAVQRAINGRQQRDSGD